MSGVSIFVVAILLEIHRSEELTPKQRILEATVIMDPKNNEFPLSTATWESVSVSPSDYALATENINVCDFLEPLLEQLKVTILRRFQG
jgi:hypothetical protein